MIDNHLIEKDIDKCEKCGSFNVSTIKEYFYESETKTITCNACGHVKKEEIDLKKKEEE